MKFISLSSMVIGLYFCLVVSSGLILVAMKTILLWKKGVIEIEQFKNFKLLELFFKIVRQ